MAKGCKRLSEKTEVIVIILLGENILVCRVNVGGVGQFGKDFRVALKAHFRVGFESVFAVSAFDEIVENDVEILNEKGG